MARSTHNVHSQEAPTKNCPIAAIYLQVFLCGITVMAIELAASRLYAPYFGSSVYVWAGLIGVLLLFLCLGHFLGGHLSAMRAGSSTLFKIVLAASLLSASVPLVATFVMQHLMHVTNMAGNLLTGIIITSIASLGIPLVLLGCVLPLSIGIIAEKEQDAGKTAGSLYAVSTAGNILGVFLPVLVTLPTLGTRWTFVLFSGLTALAAVVGLRSLKWSSLLVLLIPLGLAVSAFPLRPLAPGWERLETLETLYNYAEITKRGSDTYMTIGRGLFAHSKTTPGKVWSDTYRDHFPLAGLFSEEHRSPEKVCILGAAGGTDAHILKHVFPACHILGVEIDSGLVQLGKKYMNLDRSVDELVIGDGRRFLRSTDQSFDLIILDVYSEEFIPFHMATREFFQLVSERLEGEGVFTANIAWKVADDLSLVRRFADTTRTVFSHVRLLSVPNTLNTVLFASNAPLSEQRLQANVDALPHEEFSQKYQDLLLVEHTTQDSAFTDDLTSIDHLTSDILREVL